MGKLEYGIYPNIRDMFPKRDFHAEENILLNPL